MQSGKAAIGFDAFDDNFFRGIYWNDDFSYFSSADKNYYVFDVR